MTVTTELAQTLNNCEKSPFTESPEQRLYLELLKSAIKDLKSRNPALKQKARSWIFKESNGRRVVTGHVSFNAACEALDLEPQWVRKKLRLREKNNGKQ